MAATHWLEVSLTLDSITWHFGNFGERALAAQTEEGLLELGLDELAHLFGEAKSLMLPFIDQMSPDHPPDELLEKSGLAERGDELDRKAWDLHDLGDSKSTIYHAWVRYTRKHPERVFGDRRLRPVGTLIVDCSRVVADTSPTRPRVA